MDRHLLDFPRGSYVPSDDPPAPQKVCDGRDPEAEFEHGGKVRDPRTHVGNGWATPHPKRAEAVGRLDADAASPPDVGTRAE
jgi:hypothetical protein